MRETHWPVATDCFTLGHPFWRFGNLQDKPHKSVEVGGDGEEVGNILPANTRTAPPQGSTSTSKGQQLDTRQAQLNSRQIRWRRR